MLRKDEKKKKNEVKPEFDFSSYHEFDFSTYHSLSEPELIFKIYRTLFLFKKSGKICQ